MSWVNKSLRELAIDLASGGRPKGGAIENGIFSIGAEHLDGNGGFDLSNGKYIPIDFYNSIGKGKIKPNDVLLVKDGATTGKVSYVSVDFPLVDAAINEHVFRIELNQNIIYPKYCFYYLVSSEGQKNIMSDFRGATVGGISKSILDKIQIPLPPLATQKRIAEILDAADALRRKDQELLKKYDELAQAIFIDMFGDPVKNEKGWDVKKLGNVCKVQGGFSFKSSDLKDEGIKLVKIGNVHFENIDWSEVECLPSSYIEKYKDFSLNEDDICIALTRPIIKSIDSVKVIKVNKVDLPCLLNQRVGRFIFDHKNLNSTYLLNFIYSKYFKNTIEKLCSTSLQPNIGTGQIEDIEIPLPPINIQNLFEKRVKSLLNIKKQSSTKESHFLFNSLIQKAFKGELVA